MNNFHNVSSCTAFLAGKDATVDGSTMIARNEDAGGGINAKRFVAVMPEDQPREYISTFNKFQVKLPDNPLRYSATPNADVSDGVWGESGINTDNVAMSSTETEFTNTTMLGLDPLVPDGIGEEAMLTVTLPYIHSAREGVKRLVRSLPNMGHAKVTELPFQIPTKFGTLKQLVATTGLLNEFLMIRMRLPLTKPVFKKLILMILNTTCIQMT